MKRIILFFFLLRNVFSDSCSGTIYCPICNPVQLSCTQCSNNPYCYIDTSYGFNYCKSTVLCNGFNNKKDCNDAGCTWSGYVQPEEYCDGSANPITSQTYCPSKISNCGNICFALGDQCVIECGKFTNSYTCKSYNGCKWIVNGVLQLDPSPSPSPSPSPPQQSRIPIAQQLHSPPPQQIPQPYYSKTNSANILKPCLIIVSTLISALFLVYFIA